DLSMSNMQDADLRDASFYDSRLFSVQFLHARIGGASFSECNLERTLLENWSP
ncbi:MAG: pentapeptide repeat-containing protein, partial [Proteobacteria bacterium]|nr:pentapeptide repeat-containing protein [Pseudomonadota bacterium]